VTTPVYHRPFSKSLILSIKLELEEFSRRIGGEGGIPSAVKLRGNRQTRKTLDIQLPKVGGLAFHALSCYIKLLQTATDCYISHSGGLRKTPCLLGKWPIVGRLAERVGFEPTVRKAGF